MSRKKKEPRQRVEQLNLFEELEQAKQELCEDGAKLRRRELTLRNLERERREDARAYWQVKSFMDRVGWRVLEELEREDERAERGAKIV